MASLVLFLAGSALCGLARSLEALVLFRIIQGLGAGALQPTEQAILRQTFPPKEQGMAMALFSLAILIGPAVGPTLGGWIVDHYAWPWIFATLLSRYGVVTRASVSQHLTTTDASVNARLAALAGGLAQRGLDAIDAQGAAMQLMSGLVARQAMVLAFERLFIFAGLCFLVVLPLTFFLRRPGMVPVAPHPSNVHVEV